MAGDCEDGYSGLIGANMRHAGALRIDHVMGLARLFWIPEGGRGSDGAYVGYPRDALLGRIALESVRAGCLVVGEDLGTVPEGLRPALDADGVLGTRVLLLDREIRSYPVRSVACVSTHDLPPFAGWWAGSDSLERRALGLTFDAADQRAGDRAALGLEGDPLLAAHAAVAGSPAELVLVQVDDLVAETSSVNLPGTDMERPNWRRRLAVPVEDVFEGETARAILDGLVDRVVG
jgi:glycogen operon protein